MVSFGEQLRILLWKNWTLRKRNKKRVVIEILWPLTLFLILMWVRTRGLRYKEKSCHVVEKALPSVGGFEFFQNFVCTLNNTCYDEYIENTDGSRWEDAVMVRMVRETSPLINDILQTDESKTTVAQIWKDIMTYVKLISVFQTADEMDLPPIASFQLRELIDASKISEFRERATVYTGLSNEFTEDFLNITVNLNSLQQDAVNSILDDFQNEQCELNSTQELLTFPNEQSFQTLCKLNQASAFRLLLLYNNYINRDGLLKKINAVTDLEKNLEQTEIPMRMLTYDGKTLRKLAELGKKFSELIRTFERFVNLTGPEITSAFVYEGICGIKYEGNNTIFGVDAGAPNRQDSLRDRLKDWNPDHHYENDPEISAACNTVFQRLESMPISSFIWRQVKPIIRGYIYYAPETEATKAIMAKVEEAIMKLQEFESTFNSMLQLLHRGRMWMRANINDLNNLKMFLTERSNIQTILRVFGIPPDGEEIEKIFQMAESLDAINIQNSLERLDFFSELLSELVGCVRYNKTLGFPSETEAVDAGHKLLSSEKLWAVIIFTNIDEETDNYSNSSHLVYKIRMDSDKVDSTRSARDRLTSKGPRRRPLFDLKYITYGFVYLQEMIERSIIEVTTGKDLTDVEVYLQQIPYPCYILDQFIRAVSRTFPLFMVLSWVYASAMIIKSIVLEKERRLREVMKIMGVTNIAVWCSWFIESFVIMLISSTILSVILKYGKVIQHSDVTLIWTFLFSYTVATICFSFFISTFFSKANSAAAAGGVIFFVSYLPYNMLLIWEEQLHWFETLAGCLISNVAFGFGCTYLARYEQDGIGAQWGELTWKTLPEDDFNLFYCILMLWVDSILYLFLTWYIEAVFPGEFGVPRPWNFFMQSSYWIPEKDILAPNDLNSAARYSNAEGSATPSGASMPRFDTGANEIEQGIEKEPDGLHCGVQVLNLSKTYSNGKTAVHNLSINFYENQITSFLGHNGAGKSTTISILTGLYPPSKGTAIINGMDIRKDIDKIRMNLGICPQYNVLFDRLTVEEHLQFYASLKGKKGPEVEKELNEVLKDLGIPHKRSTYPNALSGGMKRKLSVAIAFVGGSKIVFLDEPTSGVDPYSRKSIWELLLKYKAGRTVILTTHFMDEADILGDRIAIISQGKLKALGSSLFLKSHFGQGYILHLVKDDSSSFNIANRVKVQSSVLEKDANSENGTDSAEHDGLIRQFVEGIVQGSIISENVGSEISFLLPYAALDQFTNLFTKLDESLTLLGVLSYGVSDTSLEDVFLKITMDDLTANVDSFHNLSSVCKRKLMRLLNRCHNHMPKKSVVPARVLSSTTNVTNTTAISVFPPSEGDYISDFDTVDLEESNSKMNGDTVLNILDKKSRDPSYNDATISTVSDMDAATYSLLDENLTTPNVSQTNTSTTFMQKLQRGSSIICQWCLCFTQIYMIIKKRIWNSKRNLKAIFFEIILPAVFIAVTLAFTLILPPVTDEPARVVSPWTYRSPNYIFFSEPARTRRRGSPPPFRNFVDELIGPIGMGTPCLSQFAGGICEPKNWNESEVKLFNSSRLNFTGARFDHCSCDIGTLQCPESVDQVRFPTLKTPTNDYLLDVSNTNIPEWILKTYDRYVASRYGGFELQLRKPPNINLSLYLNLLKNLTNLLFLPEADETDEKFVEARENPPSKSKQVYKIWYENKGWVSSIAYLNALHNTILRSNLPDELIDRKNTAGITLITHPMNLTKSQSKKESLKTLGLGVIHAICIIFALSFIPASFTVYLIEERKCGGKHLHLVSGVRPITYWIANFIFDMAKYVIPTALCLMLFHLFDAEAYVGKASFWSFLSLLLLYGWASVPFMYPFSFLFSVPSTAFVVLACSNLFIGVITTVSTFVLESFGDEELEAIDQILKKVFLVFPHYCLGRGCIELIKLNAESTAFNQFTYSRKDDVDRFKWEHLGEKLFFLAIHGIIYFTINLCFEYKHVFMMIFKLLPSMQKIPYDEDIDVANERERVENSNDITMKLSAMNLTKYYRGKKHPAVNGLTFGMGKGECFGLLGVNGAGKTSTFKMLTGDERISSGKAKICDADVETSLDSARKHFGYCPQEDSVDLLLTGYECVTLYGRLRGMSAKDTETAAQRLIKMLGLSRYAHRRCGTYSGGNKRKLSAAIALIGDPEVIFLDEPTSGMDPKSRRDFWKVILELLHIGKTVVLTSHSMEECEVLCTKIAIMVNGNFMCMGSLQHLKNRFGKGYTIIIRCIGNHMPELLKRIKDELPAATIEDQHCSQLKLNIPQDVAQLSEIFNTLSTYKTEELIEAYSVSQTTLDDIFVRFASQQMDVLDR